MEDTVLPTIASAAILCGFICRFLKLYDSAEVPEITLNPKAVAFSGKISLREVLQSCPILKRPYRPPLLWGKSGHIQTAVYGVLGHARLKRTFDKRHRLNLPDGTTVTFDVFEPRVPHSSGSDYTLVLCPGICNSSESNYIRTCVHNAQENGYRCAVLNHLGALANISLSSSRIFAYGNTEELDSIVDELIDLYPDTKFISVGFSLGANMTTLFLYRVPPEKREKFLLGLSVCQGYDARGSGMLHDWDHGRRVYNYIITGNVKRLLKRNYHTAMEPHVRSRLIDESDVFNATSIHSMDELYNRRAQNYESVSEMYAACSSLLKIESIQIPMVFVNSADDPLFPPELYRPVRQICAHHDRHAFIKLKHGGHLGFLEGSSWNPDSISWLDKFIVELANSAVEYYETRVAVTTPLPAD